MNYENLQEVTMSTQLFVTRFHTPGGRDARVSRQELGAESLLPESQPLVGVNLTTPECPHLLTERL